jgi:putative MATE family efflux protein
VRREAGADDGPGPSSSGAAESAAAAAAAAAAPPPPPPPALSSADAADAAAAATDAVVTHVIVGNVVELPAALVSNSAALATADEEGEEEGGALTHATPPSLPARLSAAAARARSALHSPLDASIVGLAVPALFSLLLDPLMSLVDTGLVGRLGTEPLAAVGLSSIMFTFFAILFNFLIFVTTPAVARAMAAGDRAEASRVTARGLWIAGVAGTASGIGLWVAAPALAARAGAGPAVASLAATYLRCRALAAPALLAIFVSAGSFRGVRDTRTPLIAAVVSNAVNLAGDCVLMFGLGMGVAGAALATAASQYVSAAILLAALVRTGLLNPADVARPPTLASAAPLLRAGAALSLRNLSTMGVIILGTSMVSSLGAASLAAHEVLRQLYIVSIQVFSSLDVAAQSLVASHLGHGDRAAARAVLVRVLQLGTAAGGAVGLALAAGARALPALFTADAAVAASAAAVMPIVAAFMPVDAAAAVLDGGLLGASETAWVSRTTVAVSAVCLAALLAARRAGGGLAAVWLSLKVLTIGRTLAAGVRYAMPGSPLGTGEVKAAAKAA